MAEEVTKVVENIDKLFSEIVVNGESHTSDRYVSPEPAQADSVSTNQTEASSSSPQQVTKVVEGVDRLFSEIEINGESHTSDNYVPPVQNETPVVTQEDITPAQTSDTPPQEVTKVVEGVDRLFSEIEVNGENHTSDRYVPPEPAQANPVSTNQEEEEQTSSTPQRDVQGEPVNRLSLNNILHDLRDSPLTQEVLAIQQAINTLQGRLNDLVTSVGNINAKIPAQASSTNQLADKDFVNSSISTNTANFLGTYSTLAEIEAIPNPTNNDYAFLETADTSGNNVYDRYKYSAEDEEWLFEYELNNSSFTAEQWATINSGITEVSDTVQSGDSNPVSSEAVARDAVLKSEITDEVAIDNMYSVSSNAVARAISEGIKRKWTETKAPVSGTNASNITWTCLETYGGLKICFGRATSVRNSSAFGNIYYSSGADEQWYYPSNFFTQSPTCLMEISSDGMWMFAPQQIQGADKNKTKKVCPASGVAFSNLTIRYDILSIGI